MNLIKIKNFDFEKIIVERMESQARHWKKIFAKHIKDLNPKYFEQYLLNSNKTTHTHMRSEQISYPRRYTDGKSNIWKDRWHYH